MSVFGINKCQIREVLNSKKTSMAQSLLYNVSLLSVKIGKQQKSSTISMSMSHPGTN